MTRVYTAVGGLILRSGRPVADDTAAAVIEGVHLSNADYWLTREDLSPLARKTMSGIDRELAEEMAEARRQAAEHNQLKEAA